MAFRRLPNELLENIIPHALQEGFESLAVRVRPNSAILYKVPRDIWFA